MKSHLVDGESIYLGPVLEEKLEQLESTIESLEDNVNKLHVALEKKGVNSRGEMDIFGRVFAMPVRS